MAIAKWAVTSSLSKSHKSGAYVKYRMADQLRHYHFDKAVQFGNTASRTFNRSLVKVAGI